MRQNTLDRRQDDRRQGDRRVADRRSGDNKYVKRKVERRKGDRRVSDRRINERRSSDRRSDRFEFLKIVSMVVFVLAALGILTYHLYPSSQEVIDFQADMQNRLIIPQHPEQAYFDDPDYAQGVMREEDISARVPLNDGEIIVSIVNGNFDGLIETQFVAYRNIMEIDSPIYITYIDYNYETQRHFRSWTGATLATSPGTVNLYTMDIVGDRSLCVVVSGLNSQGEHTLTVFRRAYTPGINIGYFYRIADIRIDGAIIIREIERSQAYRMGIAPGQSFTISAFGRDLESENILDQIETTYSFDNARGIYTESGRTRIPGAQVEQRQVRELLGNLAAFENFLSGLWHFVPAQGEIDSSQYIYFDLFSREIIFSDMETQQVFRWQSSSVTRFGLIISSQNMSISTLRRNVEIELESMDSIRIRVGEDMRPLIWGNTMWDGSYNKAVIQGRQQQITQNNVDAFLDARYDSPMGRIRFFPDGRLEISSENSLRHGSYTFFSIENEKYLELRMPDSRESYLVSGNHPGNLSLAGIRIGAAGIETLGTLPMLLTLASE